MSTHVFFFGGFQATQTDMKVWLGSATAQQPKVGFTAYAWPGGAGSGASSAVSTFTKGGQFASAVAAIQGSGADLIYLVGHSSGCAIANAVDRGLKDHSKVVLVALDGFGPDGKQLARANTQVWGAKCGDARSMHYEKLKKLAGAQFHDYEATNCKTSWALHFSLVNAGARDGVVKNIATGYANCRANLAWL